MQKVLFVTNIANKIGSFTAASLQAAKAVGIEFHMVARWKVDAETMQQLQKEHGVFLHHIDLERSPYSLRNRKAYKQLVKLIKDEQIDYIHCNTPTGGILGRLAGKKCKVKKVLYQVHGFHFYKGAPKKNWLIYYPVEKWLARYTDALITINQEDYALAKAKMKLKKSGPVYYVPGVGIDVRKIENVQTTKVKKRQELGIPSDATLLLSVGELNKNKNHETVIRAIAGLNVYYVIAGKGPLEPRLKALIDELNLTDRVKLLGFRRDIYELCKAADIFVFPSFREGLSISIMEAMASGLPCVVSRIRGNTDLIEEGQGGFLCAPKDSAAFAAAISRLASDADLREKMSRHNLERIKDFDTSVVIEQMTKIYQEIFEGK